MVYLFIYCLLEDDVKAEDVLACIVYCDCCGECTVCIKCKSVGYDLIINCCSILYYVLIVYLKAGLLFFFFF